MTATTPTLTFPADFDPFTATDEQLAEMFADSEWEQFLDEMAAQRSADEELMAARLEREHRDRFGNSMLDETSLPW